MKTKKREYQTRKKRRARAESTLFCSFCGKGDAELDHLIKAETQPIPCTVAIQIGAGEPDTVLEASAAFVPCICNECVALCVDVLAENKKGGTAGTGPANHKEQPSCQ